LAPLCASQYAFNLFSHTTKIGENGYNEEEMKMVKETRKIWGVRALSAQLSSVQSSVACSLARRIVALAWAVSLGLGARMGVRSADDDYIHHYRPELRLSAGVDTYYAPLLRSSGRSCAAPAASAHRGWALRLKRRSLVAFPSQIEDVQITATCIRVPVMRAHAESINLTFAKSISEEEAMKALSSAKGVSIINDRAANRFPMPLDATNMDDVYVGRVRADISQPAGRGLDLFVCGDQIRKGAALNAIQIAELLL
jgi:aspartate-semialdehyde dehydrogenase